MTGASGTSALTGPSVSPQANVAPATAGEVEGLHHEVNAPSRRVWRAIATSVPAVITITGVVAVIAAMIA